MARRIFKAEKGQVTPGRSSEKPVRHLKDTSDTRRHIAQMAAQLIAEGTNDYQIAKQKAAHRLGVSDGFSLPNNHEIELAVREYHALFAGERQPRILAELREIALRAMEQLAQFSPWLVGAVLNGTANEFSGIELELVGVDPKEFELFLLNAGMRFATRGASHTRAAVPGCSPRSTGYRLEFAGTPVTITLYDCHADRQSAHPRDSIFHDRAQRIDAAKRFTAGARKSP